MCQLLFSDLMQGQKGSKLSDYIVDAEMNPDLADFQDKDTEIVTKKSKDVKATYSASSELSRSTSYKEIQHSPKEKDEKTKTEELLWKRSDSGQEEASVPHASRDLNEKSGTGNAKSNRPVRIKLDYEDSEESEMSEGFGKSENQNKPGLVGNEQRSNKQAIAGDDNNIITEKDLTKMIETDFDDFFDM